MRGTLSLYLAFGAPFTPSVLLIARTDCFLLAFGCVNLVLLAFLSLYIINIIIVIVTKILRGCLCKVRKLCTRSLHTLDLVGNLCYDICGKV